MKKFDRKLILSDGSEYCGYGVGSKLEKITEIVFNTSSVGYQEILSDPSYTYQTVVMAYPLIGNYGMAEDDFETDIPTIGGLAVRDYNDQPSNFRSKYTLSEIMEKYRIPGICGIDTRKLIRSICDLGSRKALLTDIDTSLQEGLCKLEIYDIPEDAVSQVSRKEIQQYPVPDGKYHVAAVDCGMKLEITSQNHSYAVDEASLANTRLKATHINLLDQTVEGVACEEDKAFGVQYHPESAPGPQDSDYLFGQFIKMMEGTKDGEKN